MCVCVCALHIYPSGAYIHWSSCFAEFLNHGEEQQPPSEQQWRDGRLTKHAGLQKGRTLNNYEDGYFVKGIAFLTEQAV